MPKCDNYIPCPVCQSNGNKKLAFTKNSYTIYVCAECTLLFVSPQPSPDDLKKIYTVDYFKRGGKYISERRSFSSKETLQNDLAKIEIIKKIKMTGDILDVGCA
jgi:hypothetical protein